MPIELVVTWSIFELCVSNLKLKLIKKRLTSIKLPFSAVIVHNAPGMNDVIGISIVPINLVVPLITTETVSSKTITFSVIHIKLKYQYVVFIAIGRFLFLS